MNSEKLGVRDDPLRGQAPAISLLLRVDATHAAPLSDGELGPVERLGDFRNAVVLLDEVPTNEFVEGGLDSFKSAEDLLELRNLNTGTASVESL
jgi:hypothetical protein